MVMKLTSVHDVIVACTATLDAAVSYHVFDGPVAAKPHRGETVFVTIGAIEPYNDEDGNPVESASMNQVWKGLGARARDEDLHIPCCAVGKSSTVALARGLALGAVQDAFTNLGLHPTNETYNALVSDITSIESKNAPGGAIVIAKFVITAQARLT